VRIELRTGERRPPCPSCHAAVDWRLVSTRRRAARDDKRVSGREEEKADGGEAV
jgi:hypothetical protein